MSHRYRLEPALGQVEMLVGHCANARYVWNLAVQQTALKDFHQALRNWWGGSHCRPTWRRQFVHESFCPVVNSPPAPRTGPSGGA